MRQVRRRRRRQEERVEQAAEIGPHHRRHRIGRRATATAAIAAAARQLGHRHLPRRTGVGCFDGFRKGTPVRLMRGLTRWSW